MRACLFFAMTLVPAAAAADDLTAQQIADKVLENNSFGFQDAVAKVTLKLISKRGSERIRQIEIRSLEEKDLSKTLVRFHAPADVAGTGFLVLENQDRDDDQYLYLPALGKVKRITSSQKNQRFMGTDLTYADLESRNLRKSDLKRLPDADVGGNAAYVLEAVPKEGEDSQYSKTISWVHKISFVPLKVEFFDKKGKLLKVLKAKRLEKKDGHWVVMDSTVKNEQSNTQTDMTVESIDFGVKLTDSEFTQRALSEG
jgi:outer membrane lipoprotein-sorting protein